MHSSARSKGSISDALTPPDSCTPRSYSGSSMAAQSGRCSACLSTTTRDGKFAPGSKGIDLSARFAIKPSFPAPAISLSLWPSRCKTKALSQQINGTAVLTMASNTGRTSVGELLITRSMSAVAVWRFSASCVSLNSRAFCMAITAWSAKAFNMRLSLLLNGRMSKRSADNAPTTSPSEVIAALSIDAL